MLDNSLCTVVRMLPIFTLISYCNFIVADAFDNFLSNALFLIAGDHKIEKKKSNRYKRRRQSDRFRLFSNFFFLIFYFHLILIIISSDFREGNTSLLYKGLMATRALTLRVRLLGQNLKKDNMNQKNVCFFSKKIC